MPLGLSSFGAGVEFDSDTLSAGVPFVGPSPLAVMFGVGAESGSDFTVESLRDNGFGTNCASSDGDNLNVMSFFCVCFVFFSAFIFDVDMVMVSVAVDIMTGREESDRRQGDGKARFSGRRDALNLGRWCCRNLPRQGTSVRNTRLPGSRVDYWEVCM